MTRESGAITRRELLRKAIRAGTGLVIADAAVSLIPSSIFGSQGRGVMRKSFWEEVASGNWWTPVEHIRARSKEELQGVQFLDPKDLSDAHRQILGLRKEKPIPWDGPRMAVVCSGLSKLPPHFYFPDVLPGGKTQPLNFILTDHSPIFMETQIKTNWEGILEAGKAVVQGQEPDIRQPIIEFGGIGSFTVSPVIVFARESLTSGFTELENPEVVVAHEVTHDLVKKKWRAYVASIADPIGVPNERELHKKFAPLVDVKVEVQRDKETGKPKIIPIFVSPDDQGKKMMRDNYVSPSTTSYEMREKVGINRVRNSFLDPELFKAENQEQVAEFVKANLQIQQWNQGLTEGERNMDLWLRVLRDIEANPKPLNRVAYGAKNLNEFFAVLTEYYIEGRSAFIKAYKPYLGFVKAEELYNLTRHHLFRDENYPYKKI